jgi:hypothetical protein
MAETLRNVGGTSGAESERNGERIGESYLVYQGRSYIRDRAVRHLRCPPHSGGLCDPDGPGETLVGSLHIPFVHEPRAFLN